ncbi:uncharacterized protein SPSK_09767 [Sporothrix schenckii 1099-18]|uniref:Uncharacterized protein n=2 Tax=Sporothrix schenckii TaxID=29908 RepID=U7Q8X2_SPOS1|nr:uncharacterized protein SPSK_09767 [Sporothrix schenckii 1099-18]ERT03226.1 hypothetical protein HMPREF1624_01532 [Sporothrix schenckii ATCC 58251]KJR84351.1 hypothetical protein SPSK_09767 [Sporothrix schenckii 1099-18]
MSSDATFEPKVDVNGTTPPATLTPTQSLARVFMAEGNGRYTVILPDSSAALALKSGATDGTERAEKKSTKGGKSARGGRGGRGKTVRGGGAVGFSGMGRVGCGGVGRCNGSCLDRGGKTCNGGTRGIAAADAPTGEKEADTGEATPKTAKKNRVLVDLHTAFHNTVRVARHSIVLVDLAKAPESLQKGSRVVGTIVNVVRNPQVWVQASYWPYPPPAATVKSKEDDSIVGQMPPSDDDEE